VIATCDTNRSGQDEYVYSGSLPINPPSGFILCDGVSPEPSGSTSSEAGFEIDGVNSGSIDFSITTVKDHPFSTSGILVFCGLDGNGDLVQMCYPYEIKVIEVCPKIRTQNRDSRLTEDNISNSGFSILNNPSTGVLYVNFEKSTFANSKLTLFNSVGIEVHHELIAEGLQSFQLDVDQFSSGIYFITYSNAKGSVASKKIIILN